MSTQEGFSGDDLQETQFGEIFLREQAVRLALAGYSLEEALHHLFGLQQVNQQQLAQQAEQRRSGVVEQQTGLQKRLEQAQDAQKSAKELLERRQALEAERRKLQARVARLGAIIQSKRRQGRAAAIANQAMRRIERARREPEERLEVEFDIRRKLFQIEEACWQVNKSEYERRTQILQEEIARIDNELEAQKGRIEKLKAQGITRTVSGFLVWAGYLGFAATGSAISYVLYKRIPGKGGSPSEAVGRFIARLEQFGATLGPLGEALIPILFLLLLLLSFGCVIWGCDYALKKFDSRWTGGLKKLKKRPERQTSERTVAASPLAQFFQLPFIERSSFVQLLASLPYLFAAGVLFFLMSGSGSPATGETQDLVQSLAPNYIGAVYSLLATAASILYALYVVLPRMERAANRSPEDKNFSLVKTNWELVTLLCALIVALAIAALAPDSTAPGDIYSRVTWGSIAIAMTLSSMGLAYGLIFTGHFKDVEKGERMRRQVRTAIESFGARPTIEIGGLLDVDAVRDHLDDMHEEEESFEFIRTVYETTIAFSDEPGDFSSFLDLWLKTVEPRGKVRNPFTRSKLVASLRTSDLDTLDFEHAPDESLEIHDLNLELLQNEAELRRIDQELPALQASGSSLQEEQRALEQLQAAERADQVQRESRARALGVRQRQEELIFRAAFGLGQRFRPSGTPPPAPPPDGGGELPLN
jgi:hypothetical protein